MAITISSLLPENPSASEGSSITFIVNASDDGALPLTYEWQISTDGTSYSGAGLTNNTNNTFTSSNLTISQDGLYFRVVVSNGTDTVNSNEVVSIGDRILSVTSNPTIVTDINPLVDNYPSSQTFEIGDTIQFVTSAGLSNADVTTTTNPSNIGIQWQYSTDDGVTWNNISSGDTVAGSGTISITETVELLTSSPVVYYKYSTLSIPSSTFAINLYKFRSVVSFAGASNTPLSKNAILVVMDPQITIYQQPGDDVLDTVSVDCYKTSDTNSGKVRLEVGALSSAGTTLEYSWSASLDNGATWTLIEDPQAGTDLINQYICFLKAGTTSDSSILELERFIFYNKVGFRCIVSGSAGEAPVTSNTHYVYFTDNEVAPTVVDTSITLVEDRYGDIVNRDTFADPEQTASVFISLDIARNTGINGDLEIVFQRQDPGTTTWYDIGNTFTRVVDNAFNQYSQFPATDPQEIIEYQYDTPPLRRDLDDQAKYRLKIESSSLFTLSGSTKTLIPYYSDEVTVNVYKTLYITNQPNSATVYPNENASFSVSASPSSGSVNDISYQWQYNTNGSSTGWVNVPASSPYSGTQTNLLSYSSVPQNPTYDYYRCVLSIVDGLSSVTSTFASLTTDVDYFLQVSTLNDVSALENDNITFTVTASSISAQTITYQWEKSTNFNPQTAIGTWSSISGETTNTLNLLAVTTSDEAYYRCKVTSFGGVIGYTNAAEVSVTELLITITKDIPSSITVLEGVANAYLFECEGISSIGNEVSYQWQIKRVGDSNFSSIGTGFNSVDTTNDYAPSAFDKSVDEGAKVRCKLSADGIADTFTTECTVSIDRRFTYFADATTKVVTIGENLLLDLNPTFTGGSPTYQWYKNNSPISGETGDSLVVLSISSGNNGDVYKCEVTLDLCNQHRYFRNNADNIVSVSPTDFTVTVTISTVTASQKPTYYTKETAKSGASIGTVICVAKPDGYVHNGSATSDDISQWEVAVSGTLSSSATASSVVTSGSIYTANKPSGSWYSSYNSPSWEISKDRFPGYLEMRGQYLKAADFPELARMFGTTYGGSITGTYPKYNSNDKFRMPNLYAKRLMGTGNVNNNSGSTSIVPLYEANGTTGGDKNIPGSMGGVYNYRKSAQLPPGSPGVSGEPDGTANGATNAATFTLGTYKSTGIEDVEASVQPTFSGSVTYSMANASDAFTDTPVHTHNAVAAVYEDGRQMKKNSCYTNSSPLVSGYFVDTQPSSGVLESAPITSGATHNHGNNGDNSNPNGTFDMVKDGGMNISDSTVRMSNASKSVFDNNLAFYMRNNEAIPLNSPYFRLKYLIKAY